MYIECKEHGKLTKLGVAILFKTKSSTFKMGSNKIKFFFTSINSNIDNIIGSFFSCKSIGFRYHLNAI